MQRRSLGYCQDKKTCYEKVPCVSFIDRGIGL
jgi:hypothetical protein